MFDNDESEYRRREHDAEMGADSAGDKVWYSWAAEAEKLGADFLCKDRHGKPSLDGDEADDGYSLDCAYEAFERGETPNFYIATVRKTRREELGL